jgi:outer membrane biosynthesis protein TonB
MKDDIERFRIGARKGLPFWANDRLADSALQAAKKDLRDGKEDRAMWNLDLALSMNPRLIEAIQLKERLTKRAYWADEARVSAVRFAIESMIMQELGKPVEDVIPPNRPTNGRGFDSDVRKAFGIEERILPLLPGVAPEPATGWKEIPQPATPLPTTAPAVPAEEKKTETDKPAEKAKPAAQAPADKPKAAAAAPLAETIKAALSAAATGTSAVVPVTLDADPAVTAGSDDEEEEEDADTEDDDDDDDSSET